MSASDILDALFTLPHLPQAQISKLIANGVPPLAPSRDPDEYGFTVAAHHVVFDGTRFKFARELDEAAEAVSSLIFAARDQAGDVAHIVAARPSDGLIASWLGRVGMLGQQNLWAPRLGSDAITVHADVISWLTDERRGVVVVDADKAKWLLSHAGPLLANSTEHGRALRSALTFSPDISIPTNRKLAA
jgi:hypothetical protein